MKYQTVPVISADLLMGCHIIPGSQGAIKGLSNQIQTASPEALGKVPSGLPPFQLLFFITDRIIHILKTVKPPLGEISLPNQQSKFLSLPLINLNCSLGHLFIQTQLNILLNSFFSIFSNTVLIQKEDLSFHSALVAKEMSLEQGKYCNTEKYCYSDSTCTVLCIFKALCQLIS